MIARILATAAFLLLSYGASAQMSELTETGTGARALPPVNVTVGPVNSYIWGTIAHDSVREYIWGEAGEAMDSALNQLGIDIKDEAGVVYFDVTFTLVSGGIHLNGEISKQIGETLEQAFEREYKLGNPDLAQLSDIDEPENPGSPLGQTEIFPRTSPGGQQIEVQITYLQTLSWVGNNTILTLSVLSITIFNSDGSAYSGPGMQELFSGTTLPPPTNE